MSAGFSIHPSVFTPSEISALAAVLESASLERTRAGARHLMSIPAVRALADDARLLEIAGGYLGARPQAFRATLFDKSPGANWLVSWHQDTALPLENRVASPDWGPWSEKLGILYAHAPTAALERVIALRVHLDDSTVRNGPLRVIPGSHQEGVLSDAEVSARAAGQVGTTCVMPLGGVIAMRPLIIHASSKVLESTPRRVLHVEYAERFDLGGGIRLRAA